MRRASRFTGLVREDRASRIVDEFLRLRESLQQIRSRQVLRRPISETSGVRRAAENVGVKGGDQRGVGDGRGGRAIARQEFSRIGEGRVQRDERRRVRSDDADPIGQTSLIRNAAEGGLIFADDHINGVRGEGAGLKRELHLGRRQGARNQGRGIDSQIGRIKGRTGGLIVNCIVPSINRGCSRC